MIRLSAILLLFVSVGIKCVSFFLSVCLIKDWSESIKSRISFLENVSSGMKRHSLNRFVLEPGSFINGTRVLDWQFQSKDSSIRKKKCIHFFYLFIRFLGVYSKDFFFFCTPKIFERVLVLFFTHLEVFPEKLQQCPSSTSYNYILNDFIYLFEKERTQAGGRSRGRGGSRLSTEQGTPHPGLNPRDPGIMIWAEGRCLTDWLTEPQLNTTIKP